MKIVSLLQNFVITDYKDWPQNRLLMKDYNFLSNFVQTLPKDRINETVNQRKCGQEYIEIVDFLVIGHFEASFQSCEFMNPVIGQFGQKFHTFLIKKFLGCRDPRQKHEYLDSGQI